MSRTGTFLSIRVRASSVKMQLAGIDGSGVTIYAETLLEAGSVADSQKISESITELLAKSDEKPTEAVVSVSRDLVAFALVEFPAVARGELREAVEFELEKLYPCQAYDLFFWCREVFATKKMIKALVASAKKSLFAPVIDAVKGNGINLELLVPENILMDAAIESEPKPGRGFTGVLYKVGEIFGADVYRHGGLLFSGLVEKYFGGPGVVADETERRLRKEYPSEALDIEWSVVGEDVCCEDESLFKKIPLPKHAVEMGMAATLNNKASAINLLYVHKEKRASILYLVAAVLTVAFALGAWINYSFARLEHKRLYQLSLSKAVNEQAAIAAKNRNLDMAFESAQSFSADMQALHDERVSVLNILRELRRLFPPKKNKNPWIKDFKLELNGTPQNPGQYTLRMQVVYPGGEEFGLQELLRNSKMFNDVKVKTHKDGLFSVEAAVVNL